MITRLYNTEEDPAYCSFIWGGANLSNGNELVLSNTASNGSHVFTNELRGDLYAVSANQLSILPSPLPLSIFLLLFLSLHFVICSSVCLPFRLYCLLCVSETRGGLVRLA